MNYLNEPPFEHNHPAASPEQGAHGNPVFQIVLEHLHQRIRRGDWLPGDRLPSIVRLADDLAASTGSVREALRSLQSLGLVQIAHGRGVFVTGARHPADLPDTFQNAQSDSLVALAEARRIVEPELAALAAERGTDTQAHNIERLARRLEAQAQPGHTFDELDAHFHRCIAQAAGNPTLSRMIEHTTAMLQARRAGAAMVPKIAARIVRYHLLIAEAICDRDAPQARLLMLSHMNDALGQVLEIAEQVRQIGA